MSPQNTDPTIGLSLRQTTYLLVQGQLPAYAGHASYENDLKPKFLWAYRAFVVLVCASVVALVAAKIFPAEWAALGPIQHAVVWVALAVLSLDYGARLWSAPEAHPDFTALDAEDQDEVLHHAYRAEYVFSFLGLVNVLTIAAAVYGLLDPGNDAWPAYLVVLSLFKFGRYISGLELVATVVKNERQMLLATLLTLGILVVVISTALYLVERAAQPDIFKSVPHSMWWGIVTMTTTGYGDMTPLTGWGRLLGALSMLVGIAMLAMPAGILANGFAEEIQRREQLLVWQILSNLSLFKNLDAACIAEVASALKTRVLPARTVVVKKNEFSDAMYIIANGEVEVEIKPKPRTPVLLRTGNVFGEAGLLENKKRNATVRTVRASKFLVLEMRDFHRIASGHPLLMEKMQQINQSRAPQPT